MRINGNVRQTPAYNAAPRVKGDKGFETYAQNAGSFDIHNATFDEFEAMATGLYREGRITLGQLGVMILNPSRSPQAVKFDLNITPADAYGRRDWLAEFEARLQRNQKYGNTLGATRDKEVVQALKAIFNV